LVKIPNSPFSKGEKMFHPLINVGALSPSPFTKGGPRGDFDGLTRRKQSITKKEKSIQEEESNGGGKEEQPGRETG
jgi:hypothetical protein